MSDLRIEPQFKPAVWPTLPRAQGSVETFGETLGRVIQGVNELQSNAREATVALASGQPVDMAQALVTIEKANVSLQLALQVRNKLIEAYQDVMRMSV